jgi:hypothetical protein
MSGPRIEERICATLWISIIYIRRTVKYLAVSIVIDDNPSYIQRAALFFSNSPPANFFLERGEGEGVQVSNINKVWYVVGLARSQMNEEKSPLTSRHPDPRHLEQCEHDPYVMYD